MRAPLLAALGDLAELELVCHVFDLKLPLLLANVRLNDGILGVICLHLACEVSLDVAAAKVQILVNVITALIGVNFVGQVCISLHIIIHVFSVIVSASAFFTNNWLLKSEAFSQTDLRELEQH